MRGLFAALIASMALPAIGYAADRPVIGPPPAWVKPVPLPSTPLKPNGAPVRVLLSDQQVDLEPGRQRVYSEVALKIQTPQGVVAGNISYPWSPDTDVLTVHKHL